MRILLVTQYFAPEIGAAPVRLTALADALQDLGHNVTVLTSLPNYPTGKTFPGYRRRIGASETRPSGVKVRRVWTYPAKGSGTARYINYFSFIALAPFRMWSFRRPDVMLVESPPLTKALLGWFISRVRRVPMVLNIADLWPDSVVSLGLVSESSTVVAAARRLEQWSYRKAALVSYATVGIGHRLVERGVEEERLVFLPNGADTWLFSPRPADSAVAQAFGLEDSDVVLYAGTHSEAAGMEVILETAEMLRDRPQIALVLVGDGPAKERLVIDAKKRRLSNLVFLDPIQPAVVADLYSISVAGLVTLSANDLFVGTRPAKMFPPASCGKPLVYSGAGEGAELVVENDMGIVVPPADARALADAIKKIVDHPDRSSEMGRNGRAYVVENLAWDAIARRWAEAVEESLL